MTIVKLPSGSFRIQAMVNRVRYSVTVKNLESEEEAQSIIDEYIISKGGVPKSRVIPNKEQLDISRIRGNKECFLYYIEDATNKKIKIGISQEPYSRIRTLQCGCGNELRFEGLYRFKVGGLARFYEHILHKKFEKFRLHTLTKTSEWFEGEVVEFLPREFEEGERVI